MQDKAFHIGQRVPGAHLCTELFHKEKLILKNCA